MGHGATSKPVQKYKLVEAPSEAPSEASTSASSNEAPSEAPSKIPIFESEGSNHEENRGSKSASSLSSSPGSLTPKHGKARFAKYKKLKVQIAPSFKKLAVSQHNTIRFTKSFSSEYKLGAEVMPSTNRGTLVCYATRLSDNQDVVVKYRSKLESFCGVHDSEKAWRVSTEYLLNLPRNDNIAQLYEVLEDHEAYYVIMEKVDGLDLFEALISQERPHGAQIQIILKQLLEAVAALHAKGYIHRDLKLENVMIENSPHPTTPHTTKSRKSDASAWSKSTGSVSFRSDTITSPGTAIGDHGVDSMHSLSISEVAETDRDDVASQHVSKPASFGFIDEESDEELPEEPLTTRSVVKLIDFDTVENYSPQKQKTAKVVLGTDMYIAQEAYAGHYSPASDIFSIGVIAYKLLTGKFPYTDACFEGEGGDPLKCDNTVGSPSMRQTQEALKKHPINWDRPPFDHDKEAMELCKWMMATPCEDRPTAQQASEHPWFAKKLME